MFWWARFVFFAAAAVFFLEFGIEEMVRAYRTQNPYDFLGTFFAASFIILISGAEPRDVFFRTVSILLG